MTDEPKTETLEIPKLEIPNFDDSDKHTFENYANKYPKFDPMSDLVIHPYVSIPRVGKKESATYPYDDKRCIVKNCTSNSDELHHQHMFNIFLHIVHFLVGAYNFDRQPEPFSTYIGGVLTVLTELLSPISPAIYKENIDTTMLIQAVESLSNQTSELSEYHKKNQMTRHRSKYSNDKIEHINSNDEFFEKVMYSDKLVIADFWAKWCSPCHALSPILTDISHEMSDKVKIVKINVDEQEELSEKFKVESMPTLILFKNGQELNRIVGVKDKESIVEAIKSELLTKEVK